MTVLKPKSKRNHLKADRTSRLLANVSTQSPDERPSGRMLESKHIPRSIDGKVFVKKTSPIPNDMMTASTHCGTSRLPNNRMVSSRYSPDAKDKDNGEGYNSDDEHVALYYNPDDDVEKQFAERLRNARGLHIREVKGDGACMFRAVAAQVYGDEESHVEVRKNCMDYIARNRAHFSQFVTEDFDSYIQRKRDPAVHGNHVELQAISEIYGRQIEIYEYDPKPVITFHPITVEANIVGEQPPLMLSYHGNVHYNYILDPYRPIRAPISPIYHNITSDISDAIHYKDAVKNSEMTHIEEQMLSDKLKMTDYENTEHQLTQQVVRSSYVEYIREMENRKERKKDETDKKGKEKEKEPAPQSGHRRTFSKPASQPSGHKPVTRVSPPKRGPLALSSSMGKFEEFSECKIRKLESQSLPNIELCAASPKSNDLVFKASTTLFKNHSAPVLDFSEQPTSTKNLLNEPKEKESDGPPTAPGPELTSTTAAAPPAPSPSDANVQKPCGLYEELLATTAWSKPMFGVCVSQSSPVIDDELDESIAFHQALELSKEEYIRENKSRWL